ncbi:SprT family protein [Aeribacillus alveayuensis]|uniref:Protein SprT-like n=1 Tax=Aeribacillus alveayuensis TaxID=279215 RepID=A0ABT9VR89_9BACI|nr:SprT-like protein [Bacillus alveayuensis]
MNDRKLQQLVEYISLTFFGRKFNHKALFNHRLRTTGGRYLLQNHNIEINPKYYEEHGMDELIGIIKHELCHYHLHIEGKGYRHKDRDFKELLKKVHAPRFCTPLKQKKTQKKQYFYQCYDCSQAFVRYKKMDPARYICGKCGGKIYLLKYRVDGGDKHMINYKSRR